MPTHAAHFHDLIALTHRVCPQTAPVPQASTWAQSALGFRPDPKQTQVLDAEAQRLILCCARQWGKTTVIALKALHTAIYQPGTRIAVIAKSLAKAAILLACARQAAVRLGLATHGDKHALTLPNGSRIFAIANTEDGALGHTADVLIVDGAATISDDVIGSAIHSLSRTNGKLWLLSTPNGQTGIFYHVWHNSALTGWLRVRATIEDASFADPAFIAEQRRLFPFHARQELDCEFTPAKGRLLTRERVERMLDPALPRFQFPPLHKANR